MQAIPDIGIDIDPPKRTPSDDSLGHSLLPHSPLTCVVMLANMVCVIAAMAVVVQVGDLGLARVLPSSSRESVTRSLIGPVQWMSPEAHRGEFSRASDVYMFGATLLELVTRQAPFAGKWPAM